MDTNLYESAADLVLQGGNPVFALQRATHLASVEWNRDPLTGIVAPLSYGGSIDINAQNVVGNIKYLWEKNRHLDLPVLGQAYRLTADSKYLRGVRQQLDSWFAQCPYLMGPNWVSGLELAIRLINWSATWQLIGAERSPLFDCEDGKQFRDRWLRSVYQHVHFVRRHYSSHSSANNHLIGEAAGIFIAACTWPFWDDFNEWKQRAFEILVREANAQVASDGVDREQATAYQYFVLEFLILSLLGGHATGVDFPATYRDRIQLMLHFLASVMDVNGNIPMIGDADDGRVLRLSREPDFCQYRSIMATGALLLDDWELARKAGNLDDQTRHLVERKKRAAFEVTDSVEDPYAPRTTFPEGGYYLLGADLGLPEEVRLVADAGPLGYLSIAAHGHADALAVYLSVAGREFLIDPGTYTYHGKPAWRAYFRGTRAHNTITVDGQDQSIQGGNFMWLAHAKARCLLFVKGDDEDRFIGEHDGYRRLPDPVTHRREIRRSGRVIDIIDTLECKGRHAVEQWWHFSEQCEVTGLNGVIHADNQGASISLSSDLGSVRLFHGSEDPIAGWVSRRFDIKVPATSACISCDCQGTTTLRTTIECFPR